VCAVINFYICLHYDPLQLTSNNQSGGAPPTAVQLLTVHNAMSSAVAHIAGYNGGLLWPVSLWIGGRRKREAGRSSLISH